MSHCVYLFFAAFKPYERIQQSLVHQTQIRSRLGYSYQIFKEPDGFTSSMDEDILGIEAFKADNQDVREQTELHKETLYRLHVWTGLLKG